MPGPKAIDQDGVHCSDDLEQGLTYVRALLEQADLKAARACLDQLVQKWPESERVRRLSRLMAPPAIRSEPGGEPHRVPEEEYRWLREHAREYPGQWLALLGGRLIAADRDLGTVLDQVRSTASPEDALLHFQPGDYPCI